MKKSEQGTAIFMALLIIVIVASITSVLLRNQHIDIKRTQMMVTAEEAYLYSQGALGWAVGTLRNDFEITYNNSAWPLQLAPTPIADGQGKIIGTLIDAEGLINLNNLAKSNAQTGSETDGQTTPGKKTGDSASETTNVLTRLFPLLGIPFSESQQQDLLNAVTAWTSSVNPAQPTAMDGYDDGYTQLKPPYRSPHAPMVSASELRSVIGASPALLNRLAPYLIALPIQTKIKREHAPEMILRALGEPAPPTDSSEKKLTPSQFYLLKTEVYLRDQSLVVYTLLKREATSDVNRAKVTQIWQSFGTV